MSGEEAVSEMGKELAMAAQEKTSEVTTGLAIEGSLTAAEKIIPKVEITGQKTDVSGIATEAAENVLSTSSEVIPEPPKPMPETASEIASVATEGRENWQGFWTDPFSMLSIISFDV